MVAIGAAIGDYEVLREDWPVVHNSRELIRALLEATSGKFGIRVPVKICGVNPVANGYGKAQWLPPSTFGVVDNGAGGGWFRYWSEWVLEACVSEDPGVIAIGERIWRAEQFWHFEYSLVIKNVPDCLVELLGEKVAV